VARAEIRKASSPSLRLRVRTQDSIAIRADMARLDIRTDLTITQVGTQVALQGTVEAVRGWVEISTRRWPIERARVLFDGEIPPNPRLDVRLSHRFTQATVYIDVAGRASAPRVTFASDSGRYDQAQLLGLVLGGESPGGGANETMADKAGGAFASVIAGKVAGAIKKAGLPVDALRVGTEGGGDELSYVTVGKWINEKLFVAYQHRFNQTDPNANLNEATFQHFLARDWMWEGVAGDRGTASVDLLWMVPIGR
jgi:translocation and assembly module TamB